MDNLAQSLLVDAPMHIDEQWLIQPTKYRHFILAGIPSPSSEKYNSEVPVWLERFARLVALDIRARKLGSLQMEESPFWREILAQNVLSKQTNIDADLRHTKTINRRARELYSEWKTMSPDERKAREQENNKLRTHQKFMLLRAQETCRAKHYNSKEEAERDAQILEKLGDNILIKDRFAQLIDTSSQRELLTTVEATFDDEEPTVLKTKVKPARQGFFRRMVSPFTAAAALLLGLQSDQDHDVHQSTSHVAPSSEAIPVPKAPVEAPEVTSIDVPSTEKTYIVEKGDRLWDIAKQEIAEERGITQKRVHSADILARVEALKILNDIGDASKLEIGSKLKLEEPTSNVEPETPKERTGESSETKLQTSKIASSDLPYGNGVAVPSPEGNIDAPQIIKSKGDTAWAHADSMLEDAGVKSTTLRRRLVAAIMLKDSGKLNAYKLKIGQELTTTRANAAIEQLKTGKNPADIARSMGIEWPVRGL